MKKLSIIATCMALALSFAFAGCSSTETTAASDSTQASATSSAADAGSQDASANWYFDCNGTKIFMNAPAAPVLSALGEAKSSYEAPSCAFDGMDVVYSYPGFDLLTFSNGGDAIVSGVVLRDDTVTTVEGLFIGSDTAAVENTYGKVEDGANNIRVQKGNCELLVILTDGAVSSIQYIAK